MGLDSVELVMCWEREFSISIPDDLAATLETPDLAAAAIERMLIDEGRRIPLSEIEETIRITTLEISGMRVSDYRSDGKFVRDFGLD